MSSISFFVAVRLSCLISCYGWTPCSAVMQYEAALFPRFNPQFPLYSDLPPLPFLLQRRRLEKKVPRGIISSPYYFTMEGTCILVRNVVTGLYLVQNEFVLSPCTLLFLLLLRSVIIMSKKINKLICRYRCVHAQLTYLKKDSWSL